MAPPKNCLEVEARLRSPRLDAFDQEVYRAIHTILCGGSFTESPITERKLCQYLQCLPGKIDRPLLRLTALELVFSYDLGAEHEPVQLVYATYEYAHRLRQAPENAQERDDRLLSLDGLHFQIYTFLERYTGHSIDHVAEEFCALFGIERETFLHVLDGLVEEGLLFLERRPEPKHYCAVLRTFAEQDEPTSKKSSRLTAQVPETTPGHALGRQARRVHRPLSCKADRSKQRTRTPLSIVVKTGQ